MELLLGIQRSERSELRFNRRAYRYDRSEVNWAERSERSEELDLSLK